MALTKIDDRGLKTPIDLLDNEKIRLGTGNDLQIYHDGLDSYLRDMGTGELWIDSNGSSVNIINDGSLANGKMARFFKSGGVELYHNNNKRLEITDTGINIPASVPTITLSDTDGNTPYSRITAGGGDLILEADQGDEEANTLMLFRVDDVEILRITNGNLAIGNTSAAKKIHISHAGTPKVLIDPNYNNNSGGSSNSEANANSVVDSILIRTSFGDNAGSQSNAGHKWGIKLQGYNGNDFNQNISKVAAIYAVSEDEAGGYNRNVGLAIHTSPYNTNHREQMRVDTNGHVTKPHHACFGATGNQGVHDIASGAKIQFNVRHQSGYNANRANGFSTSNNRFTAPAAGVYAFTVNLYFRNVNLNNLCSIVPRINGNEVQGGGGDRMFFFSVQNINQDSTVSGTVYLNLAKNDYVEVYRRTGQTGTNSFYMPHSSFFGHLIG